MRPLTILLATWEGGGNVPPVMGAARLLRDAGHRVHILADPVNAPEAHAVGAGFTPWTTAPARHDRSPASDPLRDWEEPPGPGGFVRLRDRIMCGPAAAHAADTEAAIDAIRPDVIVGSDMLFGVMLAAEARAIPLALLCPQISLYPLPGLPPIGMGLTPARTEADRAVHADIGAGFGALLDGGLPPVNAARAARGLAPLPALGAQTATAGRILLATSPEFDFPADSLPPPFRYVGPLLHQPRWAEDRELPPPGALPRIVVALSSTFQDQLPTLRAIAAALSGLNVAATITRGPALAGAPIEAGPNVTVLDTAPHDQLMHGAAAVITHAGHGTAIRALTHGVPLLCLPMGRDQHDIAARVAHHGAGLVLDRAAPAADIRAAVLRLLDEPGFRAQAARLQAKLADGIADLVAEIESLATPAICLAA